jgi:hypothetical protein
MDRLKMCQKRKTLERLVRDYRDRFPDRFGARTDDEMKTILDTRVRQASCFGIHQEKDVVEFIDLTILIDHFPDQPWARIILESGKLVAPEKIELVKMRWAFEMILIKQNEIRVPPME